MRGEGMLRTMEYRAAPVAGDPDGAGVAGTAAVLLLQVYHQGLMGRRAARPRPRSRPPTAWWRDWRPECARELDEGERQGRGAGAARGGCAMAEGTTSGSTTATHHGDAPHEPELDGRISLGVEGQAGAQAVRRLHSTIWQGRRGREVALAQAGVDEPVRKDLYIKRFAPGTGSSAPASMWTTSGPVPGGAAHPAGDRAGAGPPAVCRGRPHCAQHRRALSRSVSALAASPGGGICGYVCRSRGVTS